MNDYEILEDQLERYIKHVRRLRRLALFCICFERNEDTREYLNQIEDITHQLMNEYNCEKSCSIQLYDQLCDLMDSVTNFTPYDEESYEDLKNYIIRLQRFQNRIEEYLKMHMEDKGNKITDIK